MTDPRYVLSILATALAYIVLGKFGLNYAMISGNVTLLWLPSGVALAITLLGGYRMWPGVALGALITNGLVSYSWPGLFCMALGSTLEALSGAYVLKHSRQFSMSLHQVSDVLALVVFAGLGCTLIAASFGTLGLYLYGVVDLQHCKIAWINWWMGDAMGVVLVTPFILSVYNYAKAGPHPLALDKVLEALLLLISVLVVGNIIFNSKSLTGIDYFPISLVMFPFALWSALRFCSVGAAGTALLIASMAIYGTTRGTGPFVGGSSLNSLMVWCLYTDLISITGLIIAAVDFGRKNALSALAELNTDLNKQVQLRTQQLTQANTEVQQALAKHQWLQMEMNLISEERQKLIGQELHDDLGQQLLGAAYLTACVQQQLKAKLAPEAEAMADIANVLDDSITTVRSLARGMFPVTLETGSLPAALEHLAAYSQASADMPCSVKCESGLRIHNQTLALTLYRIAQEAVSNAIRHSQAQAIEISLGKHYDKYQLRIDDNGQGMHHEPAQATLGIRSMRNRASLVGASIAFNNNPEGGFSVIVTGMDQQPSSSRKQLRNADIL